MSRIATMAVACLLLAGCTSGGDPGSGATADTSTPTTSSASANTPTEAPAGPDCDATWKPGRTLPRDYTSCIVAGQAGEQEVIGCQDGSSLVIYRDQYYAITGKPIVEPDVAPLQDTTEYGDAYSACTGEQ